eukprot:TRINITY_DN62502_c0_g1_i1.p1 TRINITY_DN62502_c0_g1~~TRINITY_DN62502_c0_g1_i1.p1  ORF type:complete len:271 (-),score=22.26 TRINITY_DN62502_c0_g1_i1:164-934(-)
MAAAQPSPALAAIDSAIARVDALIARLSASPDGPAAPPAPAVSTAAAGAETPKPAAAPAPASKKASKAAKQGAPAAAASGASESIDNFDKCDIRVAVVTACEPHPVAEKLYVCQVEVAPGEVRQVCAGLKKFISQSDLLNRRVCAVCNLKPAKLAGTPSAAMMLAGSCADEGSEAGERVKLIDPPQDAAVGDRVCIQGHPPSAAPASQLSSKVWTKVAGLLKVQGGNAAYDGQLLVVGADGSAITVADLPDGSEIH